MIDFGNISKPPSANDLDTISTDRPDLLVAVVGDSSMWGQGLQRQDKYAVKAASGIAGMLAKRANIVHYTARSGANIDVNRVDAGQDLRQRRGFADAFPEIIPDNRRRAFLRGDIDAEGLADNLYGEIPSTFPTILNQVKRIQDGDKIELLIMNGGVNDIDFGDLLNPTKDKYLELYENADEARSFERNSYKKLKMLILEARQQCPNAVIVVTGYFSPFTMSSDRNKVRALLEEMSGKWAWEIGFNDVLVEGLNIIPFEPFKDLDDLADYARRRSLHAYSRSLYWMSRAVLESSADDAVRGRGIIFAPSGFKSDNGMFASTPFIHDQYLENKVDDKVKDVRIRSYPRHEHEGEITQLYTALSQLSSELAKHEPFFEVDDEKIRLLRRSSVSHARRLLSRLRGSRGMLRELSIIMDHARDFRPTVADIESEEIVDIKPFQSEFHRFHKVKIASFVHPNIAGAAQIAHNIMNRYRRHINSSVREDITKLATTLRGGTTPRIVRVRDSLTRYGINPKLGLRAAMRLMTVDSIALQITVRNTVDGLMSLSINPGRSGHYSLNIIRRVSPFPRANRRELLTVDPLDAIQLDFAEKGFIRPASVPGTVHLSEINQLVMRLAAIGGASQKKLGSMTISTVILYINGVRVFFSGEDFSLVLRPPRGDSSPEKIVSRHTLPYPDVH